LIATVVIIILTVLLVAREIVARRRKRAFLAERAPGEVRFHLELPITELVEKLGT
jgi:hypothetical protein